MCSSSIKFTFIILILIFVKSTNSQDDDDPSKLHYVSRFARDCNSGSLAARILSIFIFVLYVLIALGLAKAIIGICCNETIGMAGLYLLVEPQFCDECDYPQPQISCNTEFCLNVVFFLVAPSALLLNMCKNCFVNMCAPTPCPETCRMEAGQDIIAKQSQTSLKTNVKTKKKAKTKKPTMDIYRDGDESETPELTNYQSCRKNNDVKKSRDRRDIHRLWP